MSKQWKLVKLGDLVEIHHGFAFKGDYINSDGNGDILLTPGNFAIGGGYQGDRLKFYNGDIPNDYVLKAGQLLVTMTDLSKAGDTLGYSLVVPNAPDGKRYLHNQRLGLVEIINPLSADLHYLNYLLRSPNYRFEILASASGSAIKHTSPTRIKNYKFPLPPLAEQRAIADILGSLDDKIEANRRQNETLEATARAIFKSWFVDFDPVHAKANGEAPVGMDAETAALFPDSFDESELGLIPSGWRVGMFDEGIEIIGGGTPKTSIPEYWDGDIYWFSVKDVPSSSDVFVIETEKQITLEGVENSSTKILPLLTTIITARGTVGKLALTGVEMAMNQSCYAIRGAGSYSSYFTYFHLKIMLDEFQRRTHGTVFDTITTKTFSTIQTVYPHPKIATAFETYVESMMQKILNNRNQSRTLAETRDALLPKLVSGEVRVPHP